MYINSLKELPEFIKVIPVTVFTSIVVSILTLKVTKRIKQENIKKNKVYYPLIDELEKLKKLDLFEKQEFKVLMEYYSNHYKYPLDKKLLKKLDKLIKKIQEYQSISLEDIGHKIIVNHFEKGFSDLFGSVIEGIRPIYDEISGEHYCDEEVEVEEYEKIKLGYFKEKIKLIIENEYDGYSIEDEEGRPIISLNVELVRFYSLFINEKRKKIINCDLNPAEYIADRYDFFEEYHNNKSKIKKYSIQKEIALYSESIIEDLKKRISKIVNKYPE